MEFVSLIFVTYVAQVLFVCAVLSCHLCTKINNVMFLHQIDTLDKSGCNLIGRLLQSLD